MACDRKIGPFDCCSVVQGDCLELMKQLPDGCVDAVITDPPYGIGLRCATRWSASPKQLAKRNVYADVVGDDKPFDPAHLLSPLPTVLWGANHYADKLPSQSGWLVWDKDRPDDIAQSTCELAWTNCVKGVRRFRFQWHGMFRDSDEELFHPTQKPVALMEWCLQLRWIPDGVVLDPYCGSGSTLVAAKKLGRHFLGFEISETYCQIARERLARIDAQPRLFEPRAEQRELQLA